MKKMFNYFKLIIVILSTSLNAIGQANRENVYDYVGEHHNSILQTFFSEYSAERVRNEKLTSDGLNDLIIKNSGVKEDEFMKQIFANSICQGTLNSKFVELPNKLIEMKAISNKCGQYLFSINDVIESDLELSYDLFYNKILLIERNIISDEILNKSEKGLLLSATSTARYSAKFWTENIKRLIAGISSESDNRSNDTAKWPRWVTDLVGSDVSGGAAGGVAGGIAGGTVTLGTLSLPSWIAGAITWGAGCSTFSGVMSLWNWIF